MQVVVHAAPVVVVLAVVKQLLYRIKIASISYSPQYASTFHQDFLLSVSL